MTQLNKSVIFLIFCLAAPLGSTFAGNHKELDNNTFAIINGEAISATNYLSALNRGMRQRFYHGHPPAEEVNKFRREIADKMVDDILLLQEAKRRGVKPDYKAVEQQLNNYERRYESSEQWQSRREKLLPVLRSQLENQSMLERIKEEMRQAPAPDDSAVQKFYKDNPEKFTTPLKRQVSLILLKVDPSSAGTVWDSARSEAQELIDKIKGGEDFSELARIHSGDAKSAQNGGDMGYLHKGMLAAEVEAALDQMKAGEISAPITTLQGVVIARLVSVTEAKLNSYASVKQRASDLLRRDMSENKYEQQLEMLRSKASVVVNETIVKQMQQSAQ